MDRTLLCCVLVTLRMIILLKYFIDQVICESMAMLQFAAPKKYGLPNKRRDLPDHDQRNFLDDVDVDQNFNFD